MREETREHKGKLYVDKYLTPEDPLPSICKIAIRWRNFKQDSYNEYKLIKGSLYEPRYSAKKKAVLWKKVGDTFRGWGGRYAEGPKSNALWFSAHLLGNGEPRSIFVNPVGSVQNCPLNGNELRAVINMGRLGLYKDEKAIAYAVANIL